MNGVHAFQVSPAVALHLNEPDGGSQIHGMQALAFVTVSAGRVPEGGLSSGFCRATRHTVERPHYVTIRTRRTTVENRMGQSTVSLSLAEGTPPFLVTNDGCVTRSSRQVLGAITV